MCWPSWESSSWQTLTPVSVLKWVSLDTSAHLCFTTSYPAVNKLFDWTPIQLIVNFKIIYWILFYKKEYVETLYDYNYCGMDWMDLRIEDQTINTLDYERRRTVKEKEEEIWLKFKNVKWKTKNTGAKINSIDFNTHKLT